MNNPFMRASNGGVATPGAGGGRKSSRRRHAIHGRSRSRRRSAQGRSQSRWHSAHGRNQSGSQSPAAQLWAGAFAHCFIDITSDISDLLKRAQIRGGIGVPLVAEKIEESMLGKITRNPRNWMLINAMTKNFGKTHQDLPNFRLPAIQNTSKKQSLFAL